MGHLVDGAAGRTPRSVGLGISLDAQRYPKGGWDRWDRGEKSLFLLTLQTLQWGPAVASVFSSKRGHRP